MPASLISPWSGLSETQRIFGGDININDLGVKPMDVKTLVKYAIDGLESDHFEIRPGPSNWLKIMSRSTACWQSRKARTYLKIPDCCRSAINEE